MEAAAAPPWQGLRKLVVDSLSSVHSRRAYGFALDHFFAWYGAGSRTLLSKTIVQDYRSALERQGLSPSTINIRLAAVRKVAAEAAGGDRMRPQWM